MLTTTTLLTTMIFAVLYPLCFWISYDDPLKDRFHRFHVGLSNFLAGVIAISIFFLEVSPLTILSVVLWKIVLFSISRSQWKKDFPDARLMSVPTVFGLWAFGCVQYDLTGLQVGGAIMGVLAGLILSASFFAMNLGHWYLNVHGLPMKHLKRATAVFWVLVGIRLLWNLYYLLSEQILYDGESMPIIQFMQRMDGMLLWLAVFFGTLFPFITLYFVWGTLKVKSNQSATGILYVIVSSILIGDISYKYYLFNFGLLL